MKIEVSFRGKKWNVVSLTKNMEKVTLSRKIPGQKLMGFENRVNMTNNLRSQIIGKVLGNRRGRNDGTSRKRVTKLPTTQRKIQVKSNGGWVKREFVKE